jgi:hypothetical protein
VCPGGFTMGQRPTFRRRGRNWRWPSKSE